MLTLFGDLNSGNVHKVQMILRRVAIAYRRVDVSQSRGETGSTEFLAINPIGKVPALLFENGDVLSESGAILYFFGRGTELWPSGLRMQSEVLRWMFFEQYSHEPAVAVLRHLKHYSDALTSESRFAELALKSRHALRVMESRLAVHDWIACATCTLADFALYPYTSVMEESGIEREEFPAVSRWLARLGAEPRFIGMGEDGASESIGFAEYIAGARGGVRFKTGV